MNVCIDYDGTYTVDPRMWQQVIATMRSCGHRVVCVTMRTPLEPVDDAFAKSVEGVFYTSRQAKRPWCERNGIAVDVWVDDHPVFVESSARQDESVDEVLRRTREASDANRAAGSPVSDCEARVCSIYPEARAVRLNDVWYIRSGNTLVGEHPRTANEAWRGAWSRIVV